MCRHITKKYICGTTQWYVTQCDKCAYDKESQLWFCPNFLRPISFDAPHGEPCCPTCTSWDTLASEDARGKIRGCLSPGPEPARPSAQTFDDQPQAPAKAHAVPEQPGTQPNRISIAMLVNEASEEEATSARACTGTREKPETQPTRISVGMLLNGNSEEEATSGQTCIMIPNPELQGQAVARCEHSGPQDTGPLEQQYQSQSRADRIPRQPHTKDSPAYTHMQRQPNPKQYDVTVHIAQRAWNMMSALETKKLESLKLRSGSGSYGGGVGGSGHATAG